MTEAQQQAQQPIVGNGNIVHTEWSSNDPQATQTFLSTVFGWQFQDAGTPESGPYLMFGDQELGIGGAIRPVMPEEPGPMACPYVSVADLDDTIKAAEANGAQVMVPKTPIPGMGWFAWFQAPGGIVVAAWQNDDNAPAAEP